MGATTNSPCCSGSANLGVLFDRAPSPSSDARALTYSVVAEFQGERELSFCCQMSQASSLGRHGILHFLSRYAQILPLPLPVGFSGSCIFRVLEMIQWTSFSSSLTLCSLPISSCSSFPWQHRLFISAHFLQARSPPCPLTPVPVRGPRHPCSPTPARLHPPLGAPPSCPPSGPWPWCYKDSGSSSGWNCALWHVTTTTETMYVALSKAPGSLLQKFPPLLAASTSGSCVLSQSFCKPLPSTCWKGAWSSLIMSQLEQKLSAPFDQEQAERACWKLLELTGS